MNTISQARIVFALIISMASLQLHAQITAIQAVDSMGRGINLGNTLEPPLEGGWNNGPAQEYYFDMYKEAGFKTVRIPVRWDQHFGTSTPFTIDPDFLDRVEQIVDWGLARDLFIIINAHHDDWIKEDYQGQKDRFDALWTQVADRFKDKPEKLFFEILNEPHGSITGAEVDELNARVLGIIRQNNPIRIVVYGGAGWSSSGDLLNAVIPDPDDVYLIGTFHSYDPWNFAGESNGTWGSASDIQAIINKFSEVSEWSEANNVPVLLGEFGAMFDCDYNSRMLHYQTYTEQALAHGFAFTVWDDGGWFRVCERSDTTWNELKDILICASDSSICHLKTTIVEDTAIQLSWTCRANASCLKKVLVERRSSSSDFEIISELDSVTQTSFIDRTAPIGEYSYYKILEVFSTDTLPSYPINAFRVATDRSPYLGSPVSIPGIIEAENYDEGGEFLTYHDIDEENQGGAYRNDGVDIEARSDGYQVAYIEAGEWLEYTIDVPEEDTYLVTAHMASEEGGGRFQLDFGYRKSNAFTAPKTNSWTTMERVSNKIDLQAGEQAMKLKILNLPSFNIDKLEIVKYDPVSADAEEVQAFSVYPNPAKDYLVVYGSEQLLGSIKIYNTTGQLALSKEMDNSYERIDISELLPGMYLLSIETGNSTKQFKIVKQN